MKKALSLLLAVTLLVSLMTPLALAAESESNFPKQMYTYSQNGYTLEKISHADVAPGKEDGIVDYYEYTDDSGFHNGVIEHVYSEQEWQKLAAGYKKAGMSDAELASIKAGITGGDGCQSYAYSAIGYGDWVYIGTMYGGIGIERGSAVAALASMGIIDMMKMQLDPAYAQWGAQVANTLLNALYGDHYYTEHSVPTDGILVKINVKTGESKLILAGSKNDRCFTLRGGCEYLDKLYFVGAELMADEKRSTSGSQSGASGLPKIIEVDPKTDAFKDVYWSLSEEEYEKIKGEIDPSSQDPNVFPTLRTIINFKGSLIASVTDQNGAHLIAFTPKASDFNSDGTFKGIDNTVKVRNPEFKEIAEQTVELFDYPAYMTNDSNYGGTIYQVIEYHGDLYVVINTGRSTLGTAKKVTYNSLTKKYEKTDEDTGCFRGWAIVRGRLAQGKSVNDRSGWSWKVIVGNTADDQWEGNDNALYTFNIDPERYAPATATVEVYNDYLYIGDYDDVTLATYGALYSGMIGDHFDFTHLRTNLEQSVNLYRLKETGDNYNVELVVGDKTNMFPNGSMSGLGSGYCSHSNQYSAKDIVWDPDKTDDNDGILFLGFLDEATILRPFAELSNGDLLKMDEEEWNRKVAYFKTLIELLGKEPTQTPTQTAEIETAIEEAAESAKVNYEAPAEDEPLLAAAPDKVNGRNTRRHFNRRQLSELSGVVRSNGFRIGMLHGKNAVLNPANQISKELDELAKLLDTNNVAEFYKKYKELLPKYDAMKDSLPDEVKKVAEGLISKINEKVLEDICAILKVLEDSIIGCDVYAVTTESNGSNLKVTPITCNGLGDSNNHTMRNFAIAGNNELFFCTGNPCKGEQTWKLTDWPGKKIKPTPSVDQKFEVPVLKALADDLPFNDVSFYSWYYDAVKACYANDLMNGVAFDTFAPDATLNRAMVVTVLWRMMGCPAVYDPMSFKDVADGLWYTEAVRWANACGIVKGFSADCFGPTREITHEQLAAIIYRFAEYVGMNADAGVSEFALAAYADRDLVSDYALTAMQWFANNGMVNPTADKLAPQAPATRAEAAFAFYGLSK